MNIRAKVYGGIDPAEEPLIQPKKPQGAKADTLHSVTVRREMRRASEGRAEDRHRLTGERARITHEGTDIEVELINLSGGGAMIEASERAARDAKGVAYCRPVEHQSLARPEVSLGDAGRTVSCRSCGSLGPESEVIAQFRFRLQR